MVLVISVEASGELGLELHEPNPHMYYSAYYFVYIRKKKK
jgi:hypothetical protein